MTMAETAPYVIARPQPGNGGQLHRATGIRRLRLLTRIGA